MKIWTILIQSYRSIWNNKGRSALTILGIVIGIAAVISLVALGNGLKENVETRVSNLGIKKITISSINPERQTSQREQGPRGQRGGFNFGQSNTENLTASDYEIVLKNQNIEKASPELSDQLDVSNVKDAIQASAYRIFGVDESYLTLKEWKMKEGTFITKDQVTTSAATALVGETVAKELFPTETALGKKIYIKDTEYTVTGIVADVETETGGFGPGGGGNNPTSNIYLGYKNWLTLNQKTKMTSIIANAKSEQVIDSAVSDLKSSIVANHGVAVEKADVDVSSSKELQKTLSSVTGGFTSTLTGIAAISLIVGGIGIMNIMLVTVTERTREIGLRRAVGAKTHHILIQFLTESVILTSIGGVVGLLVGIGISTKIGDILSFTQTRGVQSDTVAIVDTQTVILAIGISVIIGVIFGLFPAIKAARKDPIEALRYE